jgi:uncharacterized protein (TIGR03086 family)
MSVEACGQAAAYARQVTSGLTADDLGRPSPCPGWTVRDVVVHLTDDAAGLATLLESGQPLAHPIGDALPVRTPPPADADVVAELHEALDALTTQLAAADGSSSATVAAEAGVIELTGHGWDVGAALAEGHRIPEPLATNALALASGLIPTEGREPFFADVAVTGDDASASDRFVALLGRRTG